LNRCRHSKWQRQSLADRAKACCRFAAPYLTQPLDASIMARHTSSQFSRSSQPAWRISSVGSIGTMAYPRERRSSRMASASKKLPRSVSVITSLGDGLVMGTPLRVYRVRGEETGPVSDRVPVHVLQAVEARWARSAVATHAVHRDCLSHRHVDKGRAGHGSLTPVPV
jgi:hypothetical protein